MSGRVFSRLNVEQVQHFIDQVFEQIRRAYPGGLRYNGSIRGNDWIYCDRSLGGCEALRLK